MANVTDTQQFDIVITALGEGFGNLVSVAVTNNTTADTFVLDIASGTWSPEPPVAYPGDSMALSAEIQNTGVMPDDIFGTFSSGQVTPAEATTQTANVDINGAFTPSWSFSMPTQDVNISISAGHVE